jgi:tetratricopeptide (TPR) repeat protein
MGNDRFEIARLDEIERPDTRGEWIPIRRALGISAFGVNAWSGEEGAEIIGEHEEISTGHEELYLVVAGHATFTVDGEEVDGPAGTILFVRDPSVKRAARVKSGRTTILTAGGKPGEAFRVQPWEVNSEIFPLFERGEYAEAKRRLEAAVAEFPDAGGPLYNLACAEARLGETEAALEHLIRAVELNPEFRQPAGEDEDLESIRGDPRFPRP